jgi:integrase
MSKGHIRKRGQNSWELKYDSDRDGGGRRTVYRSFKGAKREAQAELARLIAQAKAGEYVEPSKLSIVDYVRGRIKQWRASGTIGTRTAERYEELAEYQLARFAIGSRPLQKLTAADIEAWHNELKTSGRQNGGGVSTQTISHAHRLLASALRDAVRFGFLLRNVASEQRPPKIVKKPMQILSPEQVRDLRAKLAGRPICALAITALFTGVRRGELLALRQDDIDLDRRIMRVHTALEHSEEYGVRFKEPKTKSGNRTIALPDIVVATLHNHRREQLEMRIKLGLGKAADNALVFPFPGTERPWHPTSLSVAWRNVASELDLGVSFHALRHTHASQLIAAGVPITEIAHRLGHASPSTTLQTYAHLFEKDNSKAAAAINAALGRLS